MQIMEEESRDAILKRQINALKSNNKRAIMTSLDELRSSGQNAIIPELLALLSITEDEEILEGITALLSDLKEQSSAEILAMAVDDPEYSHVSERLLRACWQNGLSYGAHLEVFARAVIREDYLSAIEAFTVIEEAIGEVEDRQREKLARGLEKELKAVNPEKQALVAELIKMIRKY